MKKYIHIIAQVSAAFILVGFLAGCKSTKCTSCSMASRGSVSVSDFGKTTNGEPVQLYTLRNSKGMEAKIMTYGGIVQSLLVPDKNGTYSDVVLGYDSIDGYLTNSPFFGALIGRYANRIAKGKFTLDGQEYTLPTNNMPNCLHGGDHGFFAKVWTVAKADVGPNGPQLELTYLSKDGEEGFPGNLQVDATYTVTEDNGLKVEFSATTDKDTVCNLTHHSYFNLTGSGDVLNYIVYINADHFTPVDSTLIPTGELEPVAGTPFDFTTPTAIGARIGQDDQQLKYANGYDDNWVLNHAPGEMGLAATVKDPASGRVLTVYTTAPGIQFYTGNSLGTIVGKGGSTYQFRDAFCLEPQDFPDAPNHPEFPTSELKPGETYHSTMLYKFSTE
jgi:aldose 1-epimerase